MSTKWKIRGAWRDDGSETELMIESPTATGAEATAFSRGILVSSCEPVIPQDTSLGAESVQIAGHRCPSCGSNHVGKVRGLQGIGEVFVCGVLILLLVIPGIIYYVYIESIPYCSGCGSRVH